MLNEGDADLFGFIEHSTGEEGDCGDLCGSVFRFGMARVFRKANVECSMLSVE
jgi:hypothetical protein